MRRKKMNKGIELALAKRTELENNHRYVWAIDYSINSRKPRFFIYDVEKKKMVKELKCAHGNGGANLSPHDGKTREFSNKPMTHMSNLGYAITADPYNGKNGLSLVLKGLSKTNSNMDPRDIVIHLCDYVKDGDTSICGRSWGCPAVSRNAHTWVIKNLKQGSIGYMHWNNEHFEGKVS
jgi:hypothetical protein